MIYEPGIEDELEREARISDALIAASSELGRPLTDHEVAYHRQFWGNAVKEWGGNVGLIYDHPEDVIYEHRPSDTPDMLALAESLVTNWEEFTGTLDPHIDRMIRRLQDMSIIIPTAHASGIADVPAIAAALQYLLPKHEGGEQFTGNIFQVLGPLVTTTEISGLRVRDQVLQPLSHLLKTIPTTSKSHINGYLEDVLAHRAGFKTLFHGLTAQPGNIIIIAPAATRAEFDSFYDSYTIPTVKHGLDLLSQTGSVVWPMAAIEHLLQGGRLTESEVKLYVGQPTIRRTDETAKRFGQRVMEGFGPLTDNVIQYQG